MLKSNIYYHLENIIAHKSFTVGIVGLGYVGLPTGVAFAKNSIKVIGIDKDSSKVNDINGGINPIPDIDFGISFNSLVQNGYLSATTDITKGVKLCDILLLILPTPVNDAKEPDLSFIRSVATQLSSCNLQNKIIVLESTVYPGVTDEIVTPLLMKSPFLLFEDFGVGYAPERYNPGDNNHDIFSTVKIVGCNDPTWGELIVEVYRYIIKDVLYVGTSKVAEAAKVVENIQRDVNIGLMNEIALICEQIGIDIFDVLKAASTKWNFLKFYPGPGVGGHCLPHDPYYLVKKSTELGYSPQIILAGRKVNDSMPTHVRDLILLASNDLGLALKDCQITILGASYKENIGDIRSAPTISLLNSLKVFNPTITVVDPYLKGTTLLGHNRVSDLSDIPSTTNIIVTMVLHSQFTKPALNKVFRRLSSAKQVIVDGKRLFNNDDLPISVTKYYAVGYSNYQQDQFKNIEKYKPLRNIDNHNVVSSVQY